MVACSHSHCVYVQATQGRTTAGGTDVDVKEVAGLVAHAVEAVRTRPTCLQRVQDTRTP